MSEKNRAWRKKYWASLSPEVRSQRMRDIANKKYKGMSIESRKAIGKKLALARKKKIINKK